MMYYSIATNNPNAAYELCCKYGYTNVQPNLDDLAGCLQHIVATEGEAGLKDVMELHPDKEVILQLFTEKKGECGCNKEAKAANFVNADASQTQIAPKPSNDMNVTTNTNLQILVAAFIVAIAVVASKS